MTAFRQKQEPAKDISPKGKIPDTTPIVKPEVPYTDYEKENSRPYIVDHFKLGDTWKETMGGFEKEVTLIEEFFADQIKKGDIPNNKAAVKAAIKKMEKLTGVDKNSRSVVKVEGLAAYVEFLMKVDKTSFNVGRYANK